jgi:hypothetical protein
MIITKEGTKEGTNYSRAVNLKSYHISLPEEHEWKKSMNSLTHNSLM